MRCIVKKISCYLIMLLLYVHLTSIFRINIEVCNEKKKLFKINKEQTIDRITIETRNDLSYKKMNNRSTYM